MAQFSGGMDVPMAFDFNGLTASRSGQYFQLDGDYQLELPATTTTESEFVTF